MYSVFWIPCNSHGELKFKHTEPLEGEISGEGEIPGKELIPHKVIVQITGTTVEQSTIAITSTNTDTSETASLMLKYEDCSRNGLLVYSYDALNKNASAELKFIGNNLNFGIYHQIKEFFHEHLYHEREVSIFEAYPSHHRPNIRKNDNLVLKHYFEAYRSRFKGFSSKLNDFAKQIEDTKSDHIRWGRYQRFNEDCQQIFGEEIFYRTLLSSRYNISCRTILPNIPGYKFDYDLHRLALEIENILSEIHLLHLRNHFQTYQEIAEMSFTHQKTIQTDISILNTGIQQVEIFQRELIKAQDQVRQSIRDLSIAQVTSDKTSKRSYKVGVLGMGIGIVGIFIAFVPSLFPSRLERKVDDLVNLQMKQGQQINRLNSSVYVDRLLQIDSLMKQSNEIRLLLLHHFSTPHKPSPKATKTQSVHVASSEQK